VALLGLLTPRRRWLIIAGSSLLGIAYVVRLADSGVEVVEAYTAPFAAILLAVGAWALRHSDMKSFRALGAGVTLALLPSLPQALDDPATIRGLLLGLVALGLLAVGVLRQWQAPFVGGSLVVLLLLIANIGPWTLGLPRWVLIAIIGIVALTAGATWENRARQGRVAVAYVTAMR
jgi:hypothetical protein